MTSNMDRMKKLLQYAPLLIPIVAVLIIVWILFSCIPKSYGATIEYQADYLGVVTQINIPAKNLKIYLLDTSQLIAEPFGSFIKINNLIVKRYGIAGVRTTTGKVLAMFFFDTLAQIKQKAIDYAQTHQITLKFKEHIAGQKISEWWGKTTIQ